MAATLGLQALTKEPMMTPVFVGTLALTGPQIAELRKKVDDEEVDWKPAGKDGPPIVPYLSHNGYRDRLDACFGLGGWGMLPVGAPQERDQVVYVPYALVVGGTPRAYAWGEMHYRNNGNMTYGDALEGCKSNAISRCGKELGIARDLWNRKYVAALAARVPMNRRLAGYVPDPREKERTPAQAYGEGIALAGEIAEGMRTNHEPQHAHTGAVISKPQQKRLWVIIRNSGRSEQEVRDWLHRTYKIDSSSQILRSDYDTICKKIESNDFLGAAR